MKIREFIIIKVLSNKNFAQFWVLFLIVIGISRSDGMFETRFKGISEIGIKRVGILVIV